MAQNTKGPQETPADLSSSMLIRSVVAVEDRVLFRNTAGLLSLLNRTLEVQFYVGRIGIALHRDGLGERTFFGSIVFSSYETFLAGHDGLLGPVGHSTTTGFLYVADDQGLFTGVGKENLLVTGTP